MNKSKALGILNALVALLLLPLAALFSWGFLSSVSLSTFDPWWWVIFILIEFFFLSNAWFAYNYLIRSKPLSIVGMLIFHFGLWSSLFFWSIFNVLPPALLSIVLSALAVFLIYTRTWKTIPLILITTIISVFTVLFFYEEQYCLGVGYRIQSLSNEPMVPMTDEEMKEFKSSNSNGGNERGRISVGWRAHQNCHKNFNFWEALKNDLFHFPNGTPSKDDFVSFLRQIPNQPD